VLVEASGLTRRQLLRGGVAAGLAVGAVGVLAAPAGAAQPTRSPRLREGLADPTGIHPFRVKVANKQLAALRRRVAETRWPSMELVADRSQGVQLATAQALTHAAEDSTNLPLLLAQPGPAGQHHTRRAAGRPSRPRDQVTPVG
jgi:Epoxide hydrolase N terminus